MNIATFLLKAATAFPQRIALARGETATATYGDFIKRVSVMAMHIRGRFGVGQGERVAIAMSNCPQALEALYAIWWAGCVAVPMNAKLHPKEFAFILDDSDTKLLFITPDLASTMEQAVADVPRKPKVVDISSDSWRFAQRGDPMRMADVEPTDDAWLFYTSGTTGRPKGARLTHRNLVAMSVNFFVDFDRPPPGSSMVHVAPITHGSGLYSFPLVLCGGINAFPDSMRYEPPELVALCNHWPQATVFLAPTMVKRLVDGPAWEALEPRALRTICYGGAPMYVSDLKKALKQLGPVMIQLYGQAETPMTISVLSREEHFNIDHPRYESRLASAGRPQSAVEVRVVDESGKTLPAGETGEIVVRGDTVMKGYWRNPEGTAKALREGWLWTGDMGAFDADGFLTLKDRSKDMIISGGSNIYPREIEDVLQTHPAVAEVSVIGRPHAEWGEEAVAYVVPRPGMTVTAAELDRLCLDNIARYKRPKDYRFIDALPKNNYGKILKTELRKLSAT